MIEGAAAMNAVRQMLKEASDAAELRAGIRELVQVLSDLLVRQENQPVPQIPTPQVSVAAPNVNVAPAQVSVHPTVVAPAGAQWDIEWDRTPKGGRFRVTKL
jgi:hypothetical protein